MSDTTRADAVGPDFQVVRAAEQVALHLPIAGPGSRILAYAIDYALILILQLTVLIAALLSTSLLTRVLEQLLPALEDFSASGDQTALQAPVAVMFAALLLTQLVIEWIYFLACETASGGRSIGKAVVGLRVVDEDGLPLSGRASVVRNLLRLVDVLPGSYLVGLIAMLISTRAQRLGDLAAGTLVVRLDRVAAAPPIAAEYDRSTFLFSRAQLETLGLTEKTLLRQTLRRLDSLDAAQAIQVLDRTVEVLRARLAYGPVAPADRERFLRALLGAIDSA